MENDSLKGFKQATFAGGCFWCMEAPFEELTGVEDVIVGYTGGKTPNPTYKEVCSGSTRHFEAIQVSYNPDQISYEKLLEVYWRQIDPTDDGGQFADKGSQYRTAIFYHDQMQKELAEKSKTQLDNSGKFAKPVVTQILPYTIFYPAEEYHQDYYKKQSGNYKYYKQASGREEYLNEKWQNTQKSYEDFQKPSDEELRAILTPLQYKVTQQKGTERSFDNEFWNYTAEGIYVDIVSGEPLFSSTDKYSSGTGWPSFTKPLEHANVIEVADTSFWRTATEVRSKYADSHLGHVFDDGPAPTGKRYCIDSAALRFIPKAELVTKGYGEYEYLFTK